MSISDLRLRDASVFLELVKLGSVRELARRLQVSPGQISKIVQNIESKLNEQLLERSSQGIQVTPKARELLPYFEEIQNAESHLSGFLNQSPARELRFAASSFFATHLIPNVFSKIEESQNKVQVRILEMPPSQLIPVGLRNAFHICLHIDEQDWPKTWSSASIGSLGWHLCCRKGHPVLKKKTLDNILKFPFVYPIYWTSSGLHYGDDGFPVPIKERIRGHETMTAAGGLQIVAHSDQLAFLPEILIRDSVARGEIEVIKCRDIKPVKQKVFMTVKSDIVKQKEFLRLKKFFSDELAGR